MTKNLIRRWMGVVIIVVPVLGVLVAGITYAESIQQLYTGFGSKLPYATKVACEKYQWTALFLALLVPLFWVTGNDNLSKWWGRGGLAATLLLSVSIVWVVLMGVGLYLPFFRAEQII